MSKEKTPLSEGAKKALELLKTEGSLTIAKMKELGLEANSSHLTALKNRGLITSETIEIEIPTIAKRKVQLYSITKND